MIRELGGADCKNFGIYSTLIILSVRLINEPRHDKTNKMACAQSDQSLCCPHEEILGP